MERIESKIERVTESGCWIWMASCTNGYGRMGWNGRNVRVHKAVYEMVNGCIPEGLELDHLCRVRCCVNPYHLEPVTRRENTRRGENHIGKKMSQTHCVNGHEFTEVNTYYAPSRKSSRLCVSCARRRTREWRERIRVIE